MKNAKWKGLRKTRETSRNEIGISGHESNPETPRYSQKKFYTQRSVTGVSKVASLLKDFQPKFCTCFLTSRLCWLHHSCILTSTHITNMTFKMSAYFINLVSNFPSQNDIKNLLAKVTKDDAVQCPWNMWINTFTFKSFLQSDSESYMCHTYSCSVRGVHLMRMNMEIVRRI